MDKSLCPIQKIESSQDSTIKLQCRSCTYGSASLFDSICRKNILQNLSNNPSTTILILNDSLVKLYKGQNLKLLKKLTTIIEEINIQYQINSNKKNNQTTKHAEQLEILKKTSETDPFEAYLTLQDLQKDSSQLKSLFENIQKKINYDYSFKKTNDSNIFYTTFIRPYVRPGFLDSFIQTEPPHDAIFEQTYKIDNEKSLSARVNLYTHPSTIEKLYFLYPPEFNLPQKELLLLEKVREKLSFHRPKDTGFLQPKNSKEYFKRFARTTITSLLETQDLSLQAAQIDELSEIFSRNTSGYGIIEYLLEDENIQDIYINAPVNNNPLHLVVNGEEYTSNIYLSEDDVEALASRFRSLSGRPFSEASPVLDMDLPAFHTRIAAISNPLTPKGIAFALRRHRKHPWTLAHFVKNKMITSHAAGLLSLLVDGQTSLLIAGSRGAGKTSLLTALINEIPKRFRILTIEDTTEIPISILQKQGFKMQSLVTKSMLSSNQSSEMSPTNALRTALRLGESVLILGEVRGMEAKVLFEAMRVGAAGNLIMGTIHGSTTQDVYERIVYDLGISPSSFKAVEAVIITAPIRKEGGFEKHRRVIQISETRKKGFIDTTNPTHLFSDLMIYNTENDYLEQTDTLAIGQSELLGHIAKKWGVSIEKILENIKTRAWIKEQIVQVSDTYPKVLEAPCIQDANTAFWSFLEISKQKHNHVDYTFIKEQWKIWFDDYLKKRYHE
ncbi:secretion system protein [Thermoplasmatales archaeon ex4572_165]|nr:MAG: secretion system protein [Thermoplasmatales archaeon ex4572_165]